MGFLGYFNHLAVHSEVSRITLLKRTPKRNSVIHLNEHRVNMHFDQKFCFVKRSNEFTLFVHLN